MILRRIAHAVRKQDWFSVVLEVLIVVVGIFIGLQVDDWNEERKRKAEESVALERLHGEAVLALNYFKEMTFNRLEIMVAADKYVRAISDGEIIEATDEVAQSLNGLRFYPAVSPPRSVYDELNSAGKVADISHLDVREALSDYYRELAFIIGQLDAFRASTDQFELGVEGGIRNEYNPESRVRIRYVIDGSRAFKNPAYVSDLVHELRNYIRFNQYYLGVLRSVHDLCAALAKHVGGDCPSIEEEFALYREFNPQ